MTALGACSPGGQEGTSTGASAGSAFFDTSAVHSIDVEYSEDDYQAMLDTYADSGDKDWIHATVTIDGSTYKGVGLRLKGNSSLRGLGGEGGGPGAQGAPGTDGGDDDAAADDDSTAGDDGAAGNDGATGDGDAAGDGAARGTMRDERDGTASADSPEGLPWLIRLDKYVDDQQHDGRADFVVRGNNTESSLNEAVALQVLALADVEAEQASYARFSVNGSDEQLRLVLDLPDDDLWNEDVYDGTGITYKADSEGDWSYRGDDLAEYADAFEAKYDGTGASDDEVYAPVEKLLDFVNNSSDEDFAAKLGDYLDVDELARYLAVQDLVQNSDDIDGPGNNSYLHYDPESGLFSVVAWDQNLSYGGMGGMGGGMGGPGGGMGRPGGGQGDGGARGTPPEGYEPPVGQGPPDGFEPPDGAQMPQGGEMPEGFEPPDGAGGAGGGFGGKENALVTRFLADDDFSSLYDSAVEDLSASVYDSGDAQKYLDGLVTTLTEQATDLVPAETVQDEADSVAGFFSDDTSPSTEK
ncbi:CotH kinase family protein [Cellulosimicrobium arenosum]|uniref:CotH kinase family protein n=1 Tax=Cellulosimicrobium arenosum TaxID=2708133 RepID=A0A927G8Q8_9MICO|nr:CotH kinase family protein [Cellulosimicrobium arenosum]